MAVQTITYEDKSYLNENADIPATNKVQDTDMNEIKSVVNNNASETSLNKENISNLIFGEQYSTSEVQTSKVWIDDKPIFRKVITFDATTFRNNTNLPTNISNLDNVIKLECIAKSAQDSSWRNIPWLYTSGSSFISAWAGGFFLRDNGNLQFQIGSDLANIDKVFVIIEYTKTTD
jgi:hypothetical protein